MTDWLLSHEPALRLGSFFGVFAIMALWELFAERRELGQGRSKRWIANVGISVLDSLVVRLLFPAAAVGFALYVQHEGWGLLNQVDLPAPVNIILSVVILDFATYLQHVMFHAVPALWRFHMVHHSDQDFDVTTAIRFHPVEIVLSILIKFGVIAALGPHPAGVFVFAVVLNATAMFNHSNIRLPLGLDRWLRLILVTPDMHRVHHSVEIDESNSNFGFNLPWWDRICGTYRAQPRAGHERMKIGVEHLQEPAPKGLLGLLSLPFAAKPGRYPVGKRYE